VICTQLAVHLELKKEIMVRQLEHPGGVAQGQRPQRPN